MGELREGKYGRDINHGALSHHSDLYKKKIDALL